MFISQLLACSLVFFAKICDGGGIYVVSHAGVICGLLWLAFIPEDSLSSPLQDIAQLVSDYDDFDLLLGDTAAGTDGSCRGILR